MDYNGDSKETVIRMVEKEKGREQKEGWSRMSSDYSGWPNVRKIS